MPRKLLFILPNLFTSSSIFCGIYSIAQATAGAAASGDTTAAMYFYRAAIAILFGVFFDTCDGRVARLTKTQSDFGVQLDSLADVVTFGVAPAILVYDWALSPWGFLGVLVAGAFTTCGALRLARFNVMANHEDGPSKFFTGLPIPLAAGMVVAVVVAVTRSAVPLSVPPLPMAIVTLLLSWLMVSNVKYRSLKKANGGELLLLGSVLVCGAILGARMGPNFVLLTYTTAYILIGLGEEVLFHKRRKAALVASTSAHGQVVVEGDELAAQLEDEDDSADDADA